MVLNSRHLEASFAQDFIGTFNLLDVMVGDTHAFHLTVLEQRNQPWCPALYIHGIMNPVDVDVTAAHALDGCIGHSLDAILEKFSNLRCKLGRNRHIVAIDTLSESAEDAFRFAHAVDCGSVPQVQSSLHRCIKHGFQAHNIGIGTEHGISAKCTCAPSPGS